MKTSVLVVDRARTRFSALDAPSVLCPEDRTRLLELEAPVVPVYPIGTASAPPRKRRSL